MHRRQPLRLADAHRCTMPAALSRSGIDAPCLQLCHVPAKHQRLIFRAKERESTQVRGLTVCWSRGVGRNGGSRHSPFGLHGDLGSRIVLSPTCLHTLIYAPLAACPPPHPQLRLFRAPHLAYLSESLLAPASVSVSVSVSVTRPHTHLTPHTTPCSCPRLS